MNDPTQLPTQSYQSDLPSETLCSDFELKLGSADERPRIEDYLQETAGPHRSTLLGRLILIELRYRFLSGETPELEEYAKRFPEYGERIADLEPVYRKIREEVQKATEETIVLHAPGRTLGGYQLISRVGKGGFGEVWRAWDSELRRMVAVKILYSDKTNYENIDLARHEAKIAGQLDHPHIVRTYAFQETDDCAYSVSEFIDGENLRQILHPGRTDEKQQPSRMNQVEAARICGQIARALHEAHTHGIVHRDVKPANIMLDKSGMAKLTDFGVAHWADAGHTLRIRKDVVGSANYMSPEQARGSKVFPTSDVYSLGILLYEAITGRLPFKGDPKQVLLAQQYTDPVPPRSVNPALSRDLNTVCLKALEKRPEQRYQTAKEFAEDLEAVAEGQPVKARPVNWVERKWRTLKRRPAVAVSTVAGAIAMLPISYAVFAAIEEPRPHDVGKWEVEIKAERPVNVRDNTAVDAHIVAIPLDRDSGAWRADQAISVRETPTKIRLKPGPYQFLARDNKTSQIAEVFRQIPDLELTTATSPFDSQFWRLTGNQSVAIAPIDVMDVTTANELVFIPGDSQFCLRSRDTGKPTSAKKLILPFYVLKKEYQIRDYQLIRDLLPHSVRKDPRPERELPVTHQEAMHWAEESGGRLLNEWEWEYLKALREYAENPEESPYEFDQIQVQAAMKLEQFGDESPEWVSGRPWYAPRSTPRDQLGADNLRVVRDCPTTGDFPDRQFHAEVLHHAHFRVAKTVFPAVFADVLRSSGRQPE
ncbi:serine/threonine-protein kinase [Rubinisphaera margarita]|uniref:serine/threonine-protein kinase n=1 Tax=Rubinisphaera margarita TaxID=2909586 RepID=UPI001EE95C5E|nr:serine/threonine-protein kinase [Rubinisphaera margarita]MCG6158263.1 serine/threonine protein kinase [Rubinisphaera margarita]